MGERDAGAGLQGWVWEGSRGRERRAQGGVSRARSAERLSRLAPRARVPAPSSPAGPTRASGVLGWGRGRRGIGGRAVTPECFEHLRKGRVTSVLLITLPHSFPAAHPLRALHCRPCHALRGHRARWSWRRGRATTPAVAAFRSHSSPRRGVALRHGRPRAARPAGRLRPTDVSAGGGSVAAALAGGAWARDAARPPRRRPPATAPPLAARHAPAV